MCSAKFIDIWTTRLGCLRSDHLIVGQTTNRMQSIGLQETHQLNVVFSAALMLDCEYEGQALNMN